jgi:hypothetical protein
VFTLGQPTQATLVIYWNKTLKTTTTKNKNKNPISQILFYDMMFIFLSNFIGIEH